MGRRSDVESVESAMAAIRRSQTRRALSRTADRNDATAGVSAGVVELLDALEAAEVAGTAPTVSTVAESLAIDQPRASKLAAAAVEAGLVRRIADQADGRRAVLARTAAGRAVSDRVHDFRRSAFDAAMADWSAKERKEFARLLNRFVDGMAAQRKAEAPRG